jgi:hypothetical protein
MCLLPVACSPLMRSGNTYQHGTVDGLRHLSAEVAQGCEPAPDGRGRIAQIVDIVARKVSRAELMERAGFRKKRPATKRAKV